MLTLPSWLSCRGNWLEGANRLRTDDVIRLRKGGFGLFSLAIIGIHINNKTKKGKRMVIKRIFIMVLKSLDITVNKLCSCPCKRITRHKNYANRLSNATDIKY